MKRLKRKKEFNEVTLGVESELIVDKMTEEEIREMERYQLYRDKFEFLGADCKKLLLLFFEKKSMNTISKLMGHGSEGYTRKRKHNCQKKLIELVEPIIDRTIYSFLI